MRRPFFAGALLFASGIWLQDTIQRELVPGSGNLVYVLLALAAASCLAGTMATVTPRFAVTRAPERIFGLVVLLLGALACCVANLRLDHWDGSLPDSGNVTMRGMVTGEPRLSGQHMQVILRTQDGAHVLVRWKSGLGEPKPQKGDSNLATGRGMAPEREVGPGYGDAVGLDHGDVAGLGYGDMAGLNYGDIVVANGRVQKPSPPLNPGGFDAKAYFARQGITRILYIGNPRRPGILWKAGRSGNVLVHVMLRFRDRLVSTVTRGLDRPQAELLSALLFGRAGSSASMDGSFSTIGVQHIFSVSGFHVTLLAALVSAICRALGLGAPPDTGTPSGVGAPPDLGAPPGPGASPGPGAPLGLGAVARAAVIALSCFGYSIMSGATPSSLRAAIMATVACSSRGDPANSLGLSALILLLKNPFLLFDAGFQLSFATTYSIVLIGPLLKAYLQGATATLGARTTSKARATLGAQATSRARVASRSCITSAAAGIARLILTPAVTSVAAQAGSLPLVALYFGAISPVGVLANLLILPLTEMAVISAMASGFLGAVIPGLSIPLNLGNGVILQAMQWSSDLLARIPGAKVQAGVSSPAVVAYYSALFILSLGPAPLPLILIYLRRLFRRRVVAAMALVFMVAAGTSMISRSLTAHSLRVVFAAVGQGDSIIVIAPGRKAMLIDGGSGGADASWDAGKGVVIPLLRRYGIKTVDVVLLTHPHEDHVGGLMSVINEMNVKCVLDAGLPHSSRRYHEFLSLVESSGARYIRARQGTQVRLGKDVAAMVLHPPAMDNGLYSLNDGSLVIRLVHGGVSFLFAADIEALGERQLLESTPRDQLRSNVLKVAHHGGARSTGRAFLDAVRPEYAVISVGPNPFGHPSSGTVARLKQSGAKVFRTDLDGAVIMESDGRRIRVMTNNGR